MNMNDEKIKELHELNKSVKKSINDNLNQIVNGVIQTQKLFNSAIKYNLEYLQDPENSLQLLKFNRLCSSMTVKRGLFELEQYWVDFIHPSLQNDSNYPNSMWLEVQAFMTEKMREQILYKERYDLHLPDIEKFENHSK